MRYFQSITSLALIALFISGCNGGSDDGAFDGVYEGVWDVRYNLSEDGCQIVENGITGFVDRHTIAQSGDQILLESSGGFGGELSIAGDGAAGVTSAAYAATAGSVVAAIAHTIIARCSSMDILQTQSILRGRSRK